MNKFIKEAITEKLLMLNEEKEALDSAIEDGKKKLKEMLERQEEYAKTIKETVEFLNDKKAKLNVKAATPKKR